MGARKRHLSILGSSLNSSPLPATTTANAAKVTDGFRNFAARLGIGAPGTNCDGNLLSQGHYQFNLVTRNRLQLEAAYRGSWIVGQVIDCKAEDMTRAGVEITTNEGAEDVADVKVQMSRLQIWQSLCRTIKWGDLYGGCLGVLQIKGQKLDTPINLDTISKGQFQGVVVYDRWQLNPDLTDVIDSGPEMGLPKYYDIVLGNNANDPTQGPAGQSAKNGQNVRVHHSRCIRASGHELPFWQAISEQMWGESVLERMWDRLIAFDDATMSTGNLISRAHLRTVGINGLREILGAGGDAQDNLIKQFEYMRELQNNEGITLLDKEDEFQTTAYSFAGLSDVLIQFGQQVSGAAQIPLVRLFGQSPAGMNATGESDIRLYYDTINAKQESELRNPVEMMLKVLWLSTTGKPVPKDLSFTFTPLWQLSATDKATVAKTNTDTVLEAQAAGAISMPTAMKELKQSSGASGLFSHISDEEIDAAEASGLEEPPMPGDELDTDSTSAETGAGQPKESDAPGGEKKEDDTKSPADPEKESLQDSALNGAQVSSMVEIVEKVASGELPRPSALEIMITAYNLDRAAAEKILGPSGKGFKSSKVTTAGDSAFAKLWRRLRG